MSAFDFVIKKGNLLPVVEATLKDAKDNPVDLTGMTVKFVMRLVGATLPKINTAATVDLDQVNNKGKVSYDWAGTDTDTAGIYEAEWEVTIGGKKQNFPNSNHLVVKIFDVLG